ncbi:excisionase family DNA-binding protein [Auraticoccus sp. F435]|uniref:Excisionase family DNA-binding protein n=1 Tax=Auraticoccus cholistanensis TaxID=2656650 RepID=A0A6A9UYP5_9ACTN|nr:helix-turn-helix domain-containing protein [Auraticoccus cholistanensis]MVA77012.1 excisionase family DNA-binding protein [Auraticoccus cholistanensis]
MDPRADQPDDAAPSPLDPLARQQLLTVAEVADLMRVSKMSVYRMIHGGELEAVRFGRSFRVPTEAVNSYLRSAYFRAG